MTDARVRDEKDVPTFDRRKLLKVGAWAAPALLVAAAVPAAAASTPPKGPTTTTPTGSVSINRLRIGNFRVENSSQWDAASQSTRGPLVYYVEAHYDRNIAQTDPSAATVPWTVQVTGPLGTSTSSNTAAISKYGIWQSGSIVYPSADARGLPKGTYTFTLTIFGADNVESSVKSITLS